jgi:Carboxypeptidase regulatory-like domain
MRRYVIAVVLGVFLAGVLADAQTASISGKITDQTGAVIPQATVTVTASDGRKTSAVSDRVGVFEIKSLAPGSYTVAADADGFAELTKPGVTLMASHPLRLDLTLQVKVQAEKVNVQAENPTQLDVSSASNASSLIIKGKDLEALSDDPDELESELQALAGPSAGPNGGQIYIDGFTGGQLPPKSAIREIRINQNPFSAEYDKLGYGRIEIFTKPGSDKLHGQFFFNDNNSVLNSRNPFVFTPKPSYNTDMFDGNLSGPLGKKASFFLDASRRNINDYSAIYVTDPDISQQPFTQNIFSPRTRTSFSPRLDYQLTGSNTLTMRYQLTHDTHQNSGLGQFSLPSQAYNLNETEQSLQISDTQILSPKVVNETRFQFERENSHQLPLGSATTVQVQGAFTGGGSSQGETRDTQNSYELQNYTSIARGKHFIKFGGRFRGLTVSDSADSNFNGTFIFSPVYDNTGTQLATALQAYQAAEQGQCSSSNPAACPTQFSITTGTPQVNVNWFDVGLYAEDEWRARPNLSFTYGLRFESQSGIHDHADFAPRLGVAWGLGGNGKSAPKTVLRGGVGIFYDRFGEDLLQQSERLNGVTQISTIVPDPTFYPSPPAPLPPSSSSPTIYQISPDLRAPYTMQSAVSIEQQVSRAATLSVTYLNSRGEHAFFIRNINSPLSPGGPRVLQAQYNNDNVYQYDSEGIFRENQLIVNGRLSLSRKISLFGFYTLSYANSNVAAGGGGGGYFSSGVRSSASFLSNQFDPMADYGRAAFDVRHRAFIMGSFQLPYGFSLNPFAIINSGMPYTITTGQDNNDDSIFNDRPWLASNSAISCTSKSSFSTTSIGFPQVPVNTCSGPSNATLNLRLSKTFGFGKEGGGGPTGGHYHGRRGGLGGRGLSGGGGNPFASSGTGRRYNLTLSVFVRNAFNTQNPGLPVGNLSSPSFGQSISQAGGPFSSASANRSLYMQVRFSF